MTITIKDLPINDTYEIIGNADFSITKTDGVYYVDMLDGGTGYTAGLTILIDGNSLGGSVANDLTVNVLTTGLDGSIATFEYDGTAKYGDGDIDVLISEVGTDGIDTYTVTGDVAEYDVIRSDSAITLNSTLLSDVSFELADYERVVFNDTAYAFDDTAGDVYSLFCAAFGQDDMTKEWQGVGMWAADGGMSMLEMSDAILASAEFANDANGYSDESFVKNVWFNVVGTEATLIDITPFTDGIAAGAFTKADLLLMASELVEFTTVIGLPSLMQNGIEYTVYA